MTAAEISELVGAQLERMTEGRLTIGYALVLAELRPGGKIIKLHVESNGVGDAEVSKLLGVAAAKMAAGPRAA